MVSITREPESMRLRTGFYQRDPLEIAPCILGKTLVRVLDTGQILRIPITEVEVYRGEEDKACHACRGRTTRNAVMYGPGGHIYMYFIYGVHWMLNIVTGESGNPSALLVRGIGDIRGPGRVTRHLGLDGSFYGEDLCSSTRIWLENAAGIDSFSTGPRVGIHYAGEPWVSMPWRYITILS